MEILKLEPKGQRNFLELFFNRFGGDLIKGPYKLKIVKSEGDYRIQRFDLSGYSVDVNLRNNEIELEDYLYKFISESGCTISYEIYKSGDLITK